MLSFRSTVAALWLLAAGPALAQTAPPAAPPADPCAAAEFHQFDFWAGQWDVYGPKGKQVANSLIEKVYGCGIRENWMPFRAAGPAGASTSTSPAPSIGSSSGWITGGPARRSSAGSRARRW